MRFSFCALLLATSAVLMPSLASSQPSVLSIQPQSVPTVGGTTITILGANFGPAPGSVTVDGSSATVTLWTPTEIRAEAPEGDPGDAQLVVTDDLGSPSLPEVLAYFFPSINSITPSSGPAAGGALLTVVGANFGREFSQRTWSFGGVSGLETSWLGHDRVLIISPAGPSGTTVDVVMSINGVSTNPYSFQYDVGPEIFAIQPATGPTTGGVRLTIQGSNFPPTSKVLVGGRLAGDVVASPSSITCLLPDGSPGETQVVVVGADLVSPPAPFAYDNPVINAVLPSSGPEAGGSLITVYGQNFGSASTNRTWLFGGITGTESLWLNDGIVVVEAPPGTGVVDVEVVYSPPPAVATGAFTYTGALAAGDPVTPSTFALRQNRPNPFAGRTQIAMDLAEGTAFRLAIFDINGRLVSKFEDTAPGGTRTVQWDGTDLAGSPVAAGVYFYRLEAGDQVVSKRMVLTR